MEENKNRELVGVLFPGIVKDKEKALYYMGGIKNISQAFSQTIKRSLGLSFNPENPYVKKIYAEPKKTVGILLKVKVKKKKENNVVKREVISTEILGNVNYVFKFDEMYDFQYLPITRAGTSGKTRCLLDDLIPDLMDNIEFFNKPVEPFLPPIDFTRIHKPHDYSYTHRKYNLMPTECSEDNTVINFKKKQSIGVSHHIDFNLIDEIPSQPTEAIKNAITIKGILSPEIYTEADTVQKFFDARPIYSVNAIRLDSKVKFTSLKLILPYVAYFMLNGPWRKLWIRYDYDPRKDPKSRIYQSLDFRIRGSMGIKKVVSTRLETLSSERLVHALAKREEPYEEVIHESSVIYRPGSIPLQRQIFFQLCDIKLPEVQELINAEPPAGSLCHPRWGWLPPTTGAVCRDHIVRSLQQDILATKNMDVKIEQQSSDEQSDEEPSTSAVD